VYLGMWNSDHYLSYNACHIIATFEHMHEPVAGASLVSAHFSPPTKPPRSPLRPPPVPVPAMARRSSEQPSTTTTAMAVTPPLTKRQHALHELLSSERAYASDLALVREVHIPLALGIFFFFALLVMIMKFPLRPTNFAFFTCWLWLWLWLCF